MSYRPSAGESTGPEHVTPFRRRRQAVVDFLETSSLVGLAVEDARRAVEAAGFRFRWVDLDSPEPQVLSADLVADRVTATVEGGRVRKAEPH